jgi:hypothetical protein
LASRRFTRNWKLLGLRARSSGTAARVRRLPVGEQRSAGSAYEATNRARGLFEKPCLFRCSATSIFSYSTQSCHFELPNALARRASTVDGISGARFAVWCQMPPVLRSSATPGHSGSCSLPWVHDWSPHNSYWSPTTSAGSSARNEDSVLQIQVWLFVQ